VARYTDAKCRLCRREGEKLFLKGQKCLSPKCPLEKKKYAPGQHGQNRTKLSTYGQQLREKQKTKRIYGVLERQFRRYFHIAEVFRGATGTVLLQLLERRLDNVIYRLGIATSRAQARQIVRHNHIHIDGRRVNIPSYLVKPGQRITLAEGSRELKTIAQNLEDSARMARVPYVSWDPDTASGVFLAAPSREDIPTQVREQMIVELYSK
jgi:small subunit ribosomal protein S4